MNKKSGQFFIGSIVTILALYGLVLIILNNSLELGKDATAPASMEEDAVAERIKPVAEVNIGERQKSVMLQTGLHVLKKVWKPCINMLLKVSI